MEQAAIVNVTGSGGLRGTVDTARWPLDGTRREILIRLEDGKQYSLKFLSNPNVGWQKRSLRSLHCFAVDLVKIEA